MGRGKGGRPRHFVGIRCIPDRAPSCITAKVAPPNAEQPDALVMHPD
jgi:hypothetical protein